MGSIISARDYHKKFREVTFSFVPALLIHSPKKGFHAPCTKMSEVSVTRFDHSSERVDCLNDRATIKNEVPKKKKRGRLGFCRSLAFESKDQGLSSSYTLYILYSLLLASTTLKAALVSIVAPKNKHS